MVSKKITITFLIASLLASTLSACANHNTMPMMSLEQMPMEVQSAPVMVQQAYQFAVANPGVMKGVPCYCGCGNIGHTSNYDCYVSNIDENGGFSFDNHALGCSICVDITQDAIRLSNEGRTVTQIKEYVDATYSKYGTSNMP